MKEITKEVVEIEIKGATGAGKTLLVHSLHHYLTAGGRKVFRVKNSSIGLRATSEKERLVSQGYEEIKKGKFPAATREDNVLRYDTTYFDVKNVSSQKLCELIIKDFKGGNLENIQKLNVDYSSLTGKKTDYVKNAQLIILPLWQFFGCQNRNEGCNSYQKIKGCKHFQMKNSKFSQSVENCIYASRERIYGFIQNAYEMQKREGRYTSIAVNHCYREDGTDFEEEIKVVSFILDEMINEIYKDKKIKKPKYYFIDTLGALNNAVSFTENFLYPIYDILSQFLSESKAERRGFFKKLIYGSAEELRVRASEMLKNIISR